MLTLAYKLRNVSKKIKIIIDLLRKKRKGLVYLVNPDEIHYSKMLAVVIAMIVVTTHFLPQATIFV